MCNECGNIGWYATAFKYANNPLAPSNHAIWFEHGAYGTQAGWYLPSELDFSIPYV